MENRTEPISQCKRIVVKIGTGVLNSADGKLDLNVLRDLCGQTSDLHDSGKEVVVVTSGAVASGRARLELNGEGLDMVLQQASAAVGQSLLMEQYNAFFGRRGKCVAQILLTQQDFADQARFRNVLSTFERLLGMRVIPVVNENDAVATEELDSSKGKDERLFGDNDMLSSLVAVGIKADALVILSTVDGLLDSQKNVIGTVGKVSGEHSALDFGAVGGRGGLSSKLEAMRKATSSGIFGIIANGKSNRVLDRVFSGENTGTLFLKQQKAGEQKSDYAFKVAAEAKESAKLLSKSAEEKRNSALVTAAGLIERSAQEILAKNAADVGEAREKGQSPAFLQRLALSQKSIAYLSETLRKVAALGLPEEKIAEWKLQNGIQITKVRAPLGVVLLIFESRPDVVVEGAALALKSGNSIILKGGKEAARTNAILSDLLRQALAQSGLPQGSAQLFSGTREDLKELMQRSEDLDLVVPRGGESLLRFVKGNSAIPLLFAGGGNCHLYVHEDADVKAAVEITMNAKTQKPSACNAIETLLVHQKIAPAFLPLVAEKLTAKGVELRCCETSLQILKGFGAKAATEEDWATEFLDLILAVKTVSCAEEAVQHINKYGTRHSDAIVTQDKGTADFFCNEVDSACVYWNASTRFTDGGQFGFGAELGISTQKLHVRGPIGLEALGTYKYKIAGNGNIRG